MNKSSIKEPPIKKSYVNELEEQEQTLELQYIAWACDCANWATHDDIKYYHDNIENDSMDLNFLANQSIFIEPARKSLKLPDTLGYSGDIIKFTGHFYKKKGFPKGYRSYQNPDEARIFCYTEYQVVKSNYKYIKQID